MNILIVEDERRLAQALEQILKSQKYRAEAVHNGTDGLAYAMSGQYDLVILDVMLPGMDGFELVRRLREEKNAVPVLMLTAKDEIPDKVRGLDRGADDYMTKPFAADELLARIRTLTRRQGELVMDTLSFADIVLNLSSCELCRGEKAVRLGFKEFEVMKMLMVNTGAITTKERLIAKVWGSQSDAEDNNVEAHISFLRKKLLFLGSRTVIETMRKLGYRLEEH